MRDHFTNLFEYNHWANKKCLQGFSQNEAPPAKAIELMSHVLSAQIIWFHRIKDLPTSPFPVWEVYKINELASMTEESSQRWLKFIEEYENPDFEEIVKYENTKGQQFETSVKDIMTHVINHGTYHRGQIALLMRKAELNPAITDYIVYIRNNPQLQNT